jgi:NADH-quinone oxidoreductase subunit L
VDEFYDATVLRASRGLGLLSAGIDKVVIDGIVSKVSSLAVQVLGFLFTRIQNGLVQGYAAVMVAGLLAITVWFTVPHVEISVTDPPRERSVQLTAGAGLGYQYRWDFASDGEFDTEWSSSAQASHDYGDQDLTQELVVVIDPGSYGGRQYQHELALGRGLILEASSLGAGWRRSEDESTPPYVEATERGLVVRPNGARVRRDGKTVSEPDLVLTRGQAIDIGSARLTVAGLARPTLRVRNAFGVERQKTLELTLPPVPPRAPSALASNTEPGS